MEVERTRLAAFDDRSRPSIQVVGQQLETLVGL